MEDNFCFVPIHLRFLLGFFYAIRPQMARVRAALYAACFWKNDPRKKFIAFPFPIFPHPFLCFYQFVVVATGVKQQCAGALNAVVVGISAETFRFVAKNLCQQFVVGERVTITSGLQLFIMA